ncbi:MAG: hypothetical protein ACQKBU_02745 [Verrucomicrobiales bacterium]
MKSFALFIPALVACPMVASAAFSIDFRNGIWDHSSVGGPSSSVGWGSPTGSSTGYSSGISEIETGVFVTVTSQFFGTASTGPNNLTLDPVNTPGFAIQNAGLGDTNPESSINGQLQTSLLNYQRIDFSFSTPVILDILRIGDIDTSTSSGTQLWRDTVALELWNDSAPSTPGTGIQPTLTLAENSYLSLGVTTTGMPFAWATTLGNTLTSNNPILDTNASAVTYSYSNEDGVDGFSLYLWNRGQGTGNQHAVVLQAEGSLVSVIPEPSSAMLTLTLPVIMLRRRRRPEH